MCSTEVFGDVVTGSSASPHPGVIFKILTVSVEEIHVSCCSLGFKVFPSGFGTQGRTPLTKSDSTATSREKMKN